MKIIAANVVVISEEITGEDAGNDNDSIHLFDSVIDFVFAWDNNVHVQFIIITFSAVGLILLQVE